MVSVEEAPLIFFILIEFKMADKRPLFSSVGLISGKPFKIARLVHYYETKCEVSGGGGGYPEFFLLNQIQNGRLSAIIQLNMPDIG